MQMTQLKKLFGFACANDREESIAVKINQQHLLPHIAMSKVQLFV